MTEVRRVGFIMGVVDAWGAIHAKETESGETHTDAERLSGHAFRWNLWDQSFCPVLGNSRLTEDEVITVTDWLEQNGHKEEGK